MKFELKKKLVARSDKVKSVDFHPSLPWILIGLYNGAISIYDYNTQASLQYLEISNKSIRAVKFIADKNLFVTGSDDLKLRVYNYNTMERIKELDAHTDLIRNIAVSNKGNYVLSCSDDNTIILWDIEKDNEFKVIRTYEEHTSYVMKVAVNPKENDMFASCSVDKKIKLWSFSNKNSNLTIEGHLKGVVSLVFCPMIDKTYLASGSDDKTIKIWDYTNKMCITTLESHELPVCGLAFHPELPILISSSEDYYVKFWNINSFKLEDSKMFGYDTVWDIAVQNENNMIAFGCNEGTLVMRMGSDRPMAIFNHQQGRIIYTKQNSLYSINLKTLNNDSNDSEPINYSGKHLGNTELFPLNIKFSPNGRLYSVISEKDFVISSSGVYRDTLAGKCSDLAFNISGDFAVKDGNYIKIYRSLKEEYSFKPGFSFEYIYSGPYLAVNAYDSVYFYDFETQTFIRKIEVAVNNVIWNENKKTIALVCDDVTYILSFNEKAVEEFIEKAENEEEEEEFEAEDGCEEAFEPLFEINDTVTDGFWFEKCFIYINKKNKLNYVIENQIFNITSLSGKYSLLGYYQNYNRIYFINKGLQLISIKFPINFIKYQINILKKNFEDAEELYEQIPDDYLDKVTKFLENFGLFELSYNKTKNPSKKFSLAIKLKKLQEALDIAKRDLNDSDSFKQVADLAMEKGEFKIAEDCMLEVKDYSGLLFYYSCISNKNKIRKLGELAMLESNYTIAFNCYIQVNDLETCLNILVDSKQIAEACLFCRTYCPSKLSTVLPLWNEELNEIDPSQRICVKILDPLENMNIEHINNVEKNIDSYYNLSNKTDFTNLQNLNKFQEIEIDKLTEENEDLDIAKYLDIDINNLKIDDYDKLIEDNKKEDITNNYKTNVSEVLSSKKKVNNLYDDEEEEENYM